MSKPSGLAAATDQPGDYPDDGGKQQEPQDRVAAITAAETQVGTTDRPVKAVVSPVDEVGP